MKSKKNKPKKYKQSQKYKQTQREKTKKMKYKIHQKYKRINKMKGGTIVQELGQPIGSGTHGQIFSLLANPNQVVKIYNNRNIHKPSLCKKIKEEYVSTCDELNYEYDIQKLIHNKFNEYQVNIYIPNVINFSIDKTIDKCYYIMERVYPLHDKLLLVDMIMKDTQKVEPNVGIHTGYHLISSYLSTTPEELAKKIGEMFSLLHFYLNLDGYDCELILGKKQESSQEPELFLIDFDKVSCFEFISYQNIQRKISEERFEEKELKTVTKLAYFLFSSFIAMSLLPTEPILKAKFLEGYHTYFHMNSELEENVMDKIIELVNEYEV
jgi:hypothetical protein